MNDYTVLTELYAASAYSVHSSVAGDGDKSSWKTRSNYTLRPIVINPDFVVSIRENIKTYSDGDLPDELDDRHEFCRVALRSGMNESYIVVVGDLRTVAKKIWGQNDE